MLADMMAQLRGYWMVDKTAVKTVELMVVQMELCSVEWLDEQKEQKMAAEMGWKSDWLKVVMLDKMMVVELGIALAVW